MNSSSEDLSGPKVYRTNQGISRYQLDLPGPACVKTKFDLPGPVKTNHDPLVRNIRTFQDKPGPISTYQDLLGPTNTSQVLSKHERTSRGVYQDIPGPTIGPLKTLTFGIISFNPWQSEVQGWL